jgi:peroxiredoxin
MSDRNGIISDVSVLRTGERSYLLVFSVILLLSVTLNVVLVRRVNSLTTKKPSTDVGMAIGSVSLTDPSGKPVKINLRGDDRPTVVYFYRPTCGWCRKNLMNIKELAKQLAQTGRGEVIGISLDQAGLTEYVRNSDLGFPSYTNIPADFSEKYQLGETPQTVVIMKGKIVDDWRGAYDQELKQKVETAFNARLPGLAP